MEIANGTVSPKLRTLPKSVYAKSFPLLNSRKFNHLHQILQKGRRYKVSKKQIVQSSDDRYRPLVNMVNQGYIKRYEVNNDGSIAIQAIYGPGDIFPLTLVYKSLFNHDVYDGPEIIYYETMSEVEIHSLDINVLVDAVRQDPRLYRDLLLESGVRSQSSIQRLENLALKSALKRTAHQIAFFARQFGEPKLSGLRIKILLTHQDIADVLSLTRETVSINLRRLQSMKLIKPGRYIEVTDIEGLEKLAFS